MSRYYDFAERMVMSEGVQVNADIESILRGALLGVVGVRPATISEDRNGTDHWIDRVNERSLSVDVKARAQDFSVRGHDDLALELWSVRPDLLTSGKLGWTLDPRKQTDYILWIWHDTGRWCLVPFPLLSAAFKVHFDEWCGYKHAIQNSGRWESECIYVPRRVVWRAIYQLFGGTPATGAVA